MPIRPEMRALYPRDWKAITARIRARAGNVCEWPNCAAPNGEIVDRNASDREKWSEHEHGNDCLGERCDGVRIVLTVAHLNHNPSDCRDENMLALCQLHHLRLDAKEHAKNAAATRARKRDEATGQTSLLSRHRGTR